MKKLLIALLLVGSVGVSGCDPASALLKIFGVEEKLIDSVEASDPIVTMLANTMTGWEGMDPAQQSRIIHACNTFKARGMKASEIVDTIGKAYPPAAPVISYIENNLYAFPGRNHDRRLCRQQENQEGRC